MMSVRCVMDLFKANIRFDGEKSCLHYYLCAYLTCKIGHDPLSESIINFKNRQPGNVDAWIDCAVKRLKAIRPAGLLVVRALQSNEINVDPQSATPLDLLGQAIAQKYHCIWLPQLLTKSRPTRPLHRIPTRIGRVQELDNVYRVNKSLIDLKGRWILLIDDVVTTGVTVRNVIRALKAAERSVFVMVFSLARTDYDPSFNQQLDLQGDTYNWDTNNTWTVQEPPGVYLPRLLKEQDPDFNFGDPDTYVL